MNKLSGFGAALKKLRKGSDGEGTLASLAERVGIDASDLSKYEQDKMWPSRESLERILDGLGISLLELALEVENQGRMARNEAQLPRLAPGGPDDFERRVREIFREEFASGLRALVQLPSDDLENFSAAMRRVGVEPDLEGLAVIDAVLNKLGGRQK